MKPPFRHRVLHVLLGKVAVEDVPEQNLLDIVLFPLELFSLDVQQSCLEVYHKVSLWMDCCLKQLDLLHEFS